MIPERGAKRLECVQLAGAFGLAGASESGSKLHALQTLARPRPLPTQMRNSTIRAIATDVQFWVPVVVLILGFALLFVLS